jgi:hypothetical protein
MAAPSLNTTASVLNSWKEIASYLGRGVRTVQRYERELALPVRRPRGTSRSAVIALREELDAWLRTAPSSELQKSETDFVVPSNGCAHPSISQNAVLRTRCDELRTAHQEAMNRLVTNLNSLTGLVESIQISTLAIKMPPPQTRAKG